MGKRTSLPRYTAAFVSLFVLLAWSGCSTYQNITAYFNTYYNAKRLFSDAEKEVRQAPQKDRDTNYFAPYTVSQSLQPKFDKVVEKCSKLIQFYPASSYIDDAILMIAQSEMYLGDYESSQRKCLELIENFPSSGLRFQARLLEAKDFYLMKKDDEALKVTKDLLPELRTEGNDDLLLEGLMLQAQIYDDRREYDQSAQNLELAVQVSGPAAMRAFGQYQLGVCYERLADAAKAAKAYGGVARFGPPFDLEYKARLRQGVMLAGDGRYDQALRTFDELNNEQMRPEQHGLVDLEIANTYRLKGDTGTAFPLYNLIDTVYRRTEASGKSLYARGQYYEENLRDYKLSRAYYSKAQVEAPSSPVGILAQQKVASFDRYFQFAANISRYDQILHPDSSLKNTKAADSLAASAGALATSSAGRSDSSAAAGRMEIHGGESGASDGAPPGDSAAPDLAGSVAGGNGARDDGSGGGSAAYRRRHADRDSEPDGDDGGGDAPSLLSPDSSPLTGDMESSSDTSKEGGRRRLHGPQGSKGPGSAASMAAQAEKLSPDSLRSLIARTYYELGTLFYLELNRPDSARHWYQKLIDEYPSSAFVPRTLYALAEVDGAGKDSAAVDSLYNLILARFDGSEYANQVKRLRGLEVGEPKVDAEELQFRKGEALLQAGKTAEALSAFKHLARTGRARFPFTSKALYTVGYIYESILFRNDSAETWYLKLMKEDSTSIYAMAAAPKVRVREKPELLKDFVKVHEIPQLANTSDKPAPRRRPGSAEGVEGTNLPDAEDEEVGRPGAGHRLRDDQEDQDSNDDEDAPDPDDDDDN